MVRAEAARVLARVPPQQLTGSQRKALAGPLQEYQAGVLASNDRAAAHMTLGILYESQGSERRAIAAYETAMRLEPRVTGPRTNLAAIYERRAQQAETRARQAAISRNDEAGLKAAEEAVRYHQRVARLRAEELVNLKRDALLAPDNAMIQYRLGLSLYLHQQMREAEAALRKAARLEPNTAQFHMALTLLFQKQQRFAEAIESTRVLLRLDPDNAQYHQLLEQLQQQARGAPATGPAAP